jgi:hypothetical protein
VVSSVFARWRYPAAFAVSAAIAFPAIAAAAAAPESDDDGRDANPAADSLHRHAGARVLNRPFRTLHKTINVQVREIRAQQRRRQELQFASLPAGVSQATLDSIASCESGGDPTAVSSDGSYRGKYQFDYGTWASVGGSGDPAAAPEQEQDYRAALLYAQSGSSPWPVCG